MGQLRALAPDFAFTSIFVSRNCRAKMHVDDNNVGASYQIALGPHRGGQLVELHTGAAAVVWEAETWNRTNGSLPHVGLPFAGDRVAIIA